MIYRGMYTKEQQDLKKLVQEALITSMAFSAKVASCGFRVTNPMDTEELARLREEADQAERALLHRLGLL